MTNINKIEDIYSAIDELTKILAAENEQRISNILQHRMYQVSWTSGSELLEELERILKEYLQEKRSNLDKLIVDRIQDVLSGIKGLQDSI
jgi:vacuolar-type H+-ATPase subunit E/Vma4